MQTKNFQMSKLDLEKEEEPEVKLPTFAIIEKAEEFQKNNDLYFIDYAKAFDCVDHNKLWKALKEMGQTILPFFWETCMQVKKQQLELCMEQTTGSRSRKEYFRAVFCHPVCLIYTLSASWEMPDWMSYRLESR